MEELKLKYEDLNKDLNSENYNSSKKESISFLSYELFDALAKASPDYRMRSNKLSG